MTSAAEAVPRELVARLRAVIEAKDAENAVLRTELTALRESFTALPTELDRVLERERLLGLKVAELERQIGQDSANSGTPSSKEGIGARERRKAERKRQPSERERRKDRKRGSALAQGPGPGLSFGLVHPRPEPFMGDRGSSVRRGWVCSRP